MSANGAIFIFTRNRPETLRVTLSNLQSESYHKFVIDDSSIAHEATMVESICGQYPDISYLGRREYLQFLAKHRIYSHEVQFLLRQLGHPEWNLGYARNFALLYAKSLHVNAVLFSDDDIQVSDRRLITHLFQSLEQFKFSGAHIRGLVDDSILGHIATDVGVNNERMLSGGFMAFNPSDINHFFLNNYNEDWIWLFLQIKNGNYLQTGEVFQALSDPLENYQEKVLFQEYGEVILDGVMELHRMQSFDNLTSLAFWERILTERREYLMKLKLLSSTVGKLQYQHIVEFIESDSTAISAVKLSGLFKEFANNREIFQAIFKSLA
jgi:glycosyltransferase involved in cell wall biosynthesis